MPLFSVPNDVEFSRRVDRPDGTGLDWVEEGFAEIFANRKVIIFGLPGAFTPTCSTTHLPGFEAYAEQLKKDYGIDDIYCVSVNDAFVMQAWFAQQNIKHVKSIADGNGDFTRKLGLLVRKENINFGMRSWRYSMLVEDGDIQVAFIEDGFQDNADGDPFEKSDVDTMKTWLAQMHGDSETADE